MSNKCIVAEASIAHTKEVIASITLKNIYIILTAPCILATGNHIDLLDKTS